MLNILGPNGQQLVELGGERAWRGVRTKGDMSLSMQWLHRPDIDPDGPAPCMCIWPTVWTTNPPVKIIRQRDLHTYLHNDGRPKAFAVGEAFKTALFFGMHPGRSTVARILDLIYENAADFIRMPSDQPKELEIARPVLGWEAVGTFNGKTITEEVI